MSEQYKVKTSTVETRPGCWNYLNVEIFKGDERIGEYQRNYSSFYNTFFPFKQNGKDYALYSKDYTATRVMELPSCRDMCGEDGAAFGFCPTGYFVPTTDCLGADWGDGQIVGPDGQFGFVCGCVWGDDSSWKIQFLDLSRIQDGVLKRDDRFGYIELLGSALELKDAIQVEPFSQSEYEAGEVVIDIACRHSFKLNPNQTATL